MSLRLVIPRQSLVSGLKLIARSLLLRHQYSAVPLTLRFYCLIFLSIASIYQGTVFAGGLVGDWWQEDHLYSSSKEKRAISQPVTRSTEEEQMTLGIKGEGTTRPVEFFAIVSSNAKTEGCLYTIDKITIDSQVFPINSPAHHSDINGLRATTAEAQKRLWQAFIKGRLLSLNLIRSCSSNAEQISSANTFGFSLKGSNAAYRFVAGLKPPEAQKKSRAKSGNDAITLKPGSIEATPKAEPDSGFPLPLPIVLIGAIFLLWRLFRHFNTSPTNYNSGFRIERPEPRIGDESQTKAASEDAIESFRISRGVEKTPEPKNVPTAAITPEVTSLPRYKVAYVIDGDTVVLSGHQQELRVRLDSIDCPEDGQEWGDIATAGLIKMIGGQHVHMEEHGTDRYERTLATLHVRHDKSCEWTNVNERMVTLGHAWVMRRFYKHLPKERQDKLNRLERWAKSKKVGLWKTSNPVPPWNWRNGN